MTFGLLIKMIELAGLPGASDMNLSNGGEDAFDLWDFVTLSSDFYPELARWYDEANGEWFEAQLERFNEAAEERVRQKAEFEADEALFATMGQTLPRLRAADQEVEQLDPKVAAQLEAFSGRMSIVESVMKTYDFTLEQALQALVDFGG